MIAPLDRKHSPLLSNMALPGGHIFSQIKQQSREGVREQGHQRPSIIHVSKSDGCKTQKLTTLLIYPKVNSLIDKNHGLQHA